MGIVLLVLIVLGAIFLFSMVGGIIDLLISLVIWAVIGWLAGNLLQGRGYGTLGNILLGLGGGIVGGIIFGLLNLSSGGLIMTIISGVVGAVIVIWAARMLRRA